MRDAVFVILVIFIILAVMGGIVVYVATLPSKELAQLDQTVANMINFTG